MHQQKVRFTLTEKNVDENGNLWRQNWKFIVLIVNFKGAILVGKAYSEIFTNRNKVTKVIKS